VEDIVIESSVFYCATLLISRSVVALCHCAGISMCARTFRHWPDTVISCVSVLCVELIRIDPPLHG